MEGYLKDMDTQLLYQSEGASLGPGLYSLDTAQKKNTVSYPWAPDTNINLSRTFLENNKRVDLESDIRNINRKLSNDPKMKYVPNSNVPVDPNANIFNGIKDGFFHVESSRLTNPAFELKGMAKNRWISLKKNPQDNVIEPFEREGFNTYLDIIDNYESCPVQIKK
tara:strand:- start:92 stop:589 length:498 start_codon:yes stop_codon:yes gene_type:complete